MSNTTFSDVPSGYQSVQTGGAKISELQTNLNTFLKQNAWAIPAERRVFAVQTASGPRAIDITRDGIPVDGAYKEVTHAALKLALETIYDQRPDLRRDMLKEKWISLAVGSGQIELGAAPDRSTNINGLTLAAGFGQPSPGPLSATHEIGEDGTVKLRDGAITLEKLIDEAAKKGLRGIEVRHPSFDQAKLTTALSDCDLKEVTRQLLARLRELEPSGGVRPEMTAAELRAAMEKVKAMHVYKDELDKTTEAFVEALGKGAEPMRLARQQLHDFLGQRLGYNSDEIGEVLARIEAKAGTFQNKADALVVMRREVTGSILRARPGDADFTTANRAVEAARGDYRDTVRDIARQLGIKLEDKVGVAAPLVAKPAQCDDVDVLLARR